jgi:hypothetical protein
MTDFLIFDFLNTVRKCLKLILRIIPKVANGLIVATLIRRGWCHLLLQWLNGFFNFR